MKKTRYTVISNSIDKCNAQIIVDTQKGTHYRVAKMKAFELAAKVEKQAFVDNFKGSVSVEATADTRAVVTLEAVDMHDLETAMNVALAVTPTNY